MDIAVIDLSGLDGSDGFLLAGVDANDRSGFSVSGAGDVNGDGFADVIVGARNAFPEGRYYAGESYVVFGKATGFGAAVALSALDGGDGFRLNGVDPYDYAGAAVSGAGDVNGDGFADLIVGAYGAAVGGGNDAGESYVVFGKAGGFDAVISLSALDGANGFRIDGVDSGDISGAAVSGAGDVNGDGFADVIVGARGADPNGDSLAGESYVLFGAADGFAAAVDVASLDGGDGFRLDGVDANDNSGGSVSGAGDLNGDGVDDLAVGAFGGAGFAGETFIVFGRTDNVGAALDLASLDGADGFRLIGVQADDRSGFSVSGAGDVNGDGFADLIVGAGNAATAGGGEAGASYVVFGKSDGFGATLNLSTLDGSDGFRLDGVGALDFAGFVGGAGDVNGDGFDDLIVGAYGADPNGESRAGESYVVFGKASGFAAALALSDLEGSDGFRLDGVDAQDRSGNAVDGAGDVNGDGFDDLIVGAPEADPNGDSRAGESYVIFGFDSGAVTHQGGDDGDALSGDAAANVLIGGLGADTLIGGGGLDVLKGGAGDDILSVADVGFRRADGGTGSDTLRLAGAGLTLDLTQAGDSGLADIEVVDLAGAGSGLILDALRARGLSDTSNDVSVNGDESTTLTFADAGWSLAADASATRTFVSGSAAIVVASTVSLVVGGGSGADTLLGGSGDDSLTGGAGDDSLTGGDGVDLAVYSDAGASVTVNLANGRAADGDGGTDALAEIEDVLGSTFNDILIGDGAANGLTGGAGADRLDGRAGDDTLLGGAGNDIYTVQDVGDTVVEAAGEGDDRINAFVDFANPDDVEFLVGKFASVGLTLTGNGTRDQITGANKINSPDTISGLGGNDLLVGLVGDDSIDGGAGNDRIFGNSGADVIAGGLGNDRVSGQLGADTFVHRPGDGRDKVTDFVAGVDDLDLIAHNFANFDAVDALISAVAGGTLIDLPGSDSLLLQGFSGTLTADDVLIA